jgi:hypothetical protein
MSQNNWKEKTRAFLWYHFLPIVAIIISILSVWYVRREFNIQYTPDLRTYIHSTDIYVGDANKFNPRRTGTAIEIPLAICNKSYALAKDIVLTYTYNSGYGEHAPIIQIIPVLKGSDTLFFTSAPSIPDDSYEKFKSGEKEFKLDTHLKWEDAEKNEYFSEEKYELEYVEIGKDVGGIFIFKSLKFNR